LNEAVATTLRSERNTYPKEIPTPRFSHHSVHKFKPFCFGGHRHILNLLEDKLCFLLTNLVKFTATMTI